MITQETARLRTLLSDGIKAAEGAQVVIEAHFEEQDRDPANNDNYCRLLDYKLVLTHCDQQEAVCEADFYSDGPTRNCISKTTRSMIVTV